MLQLPDASIKGLHYSSNGIEPYIKRLAVEVGHNHQGLQPH